jgi:hypothetical protein
MRWLLRLPLQLVPPTMHLNCHACHCCHLHTISDSPTLPDAVWPYYLSVLFFFIGLSHCGWDCFAGWVCSGSSVMFRMLLVFLQAMSLSQQTFLSLSNDFWKLCTYQRSTFAVVFSLAFARHAREMLRSQYTHVENSLIMYHHTLHYYHQLHVLKGTSTFCTQAYLRCSPLHEFVQRSAICNCKTGAWYQIIYIQYYPLRWVFTKTKFIYTQSPHNSFKPHPSAEA